MYDNYNYPPGADTPDAPWNLPGDPDPITLAVTVNTTLYRDTTVETTNYDIYHDVEFGETEIELHDGYSDVEKYYTEQHKSIPFLLGELAKYIEGELAGCDLSQSRRQELEEMLADCKGWKEHSFEVEEYDRT